MDKAAETIKVTQNMLVIMLAQAVSISTEKLL